MEICLETLIKETYIGRRYYGGKLITDAFVTIEDEDVKLGLRFDNGTFRFIDIEDIITLD